jgi:hypothetical protein
MLTLILILKKAAEPTTTALALAALLSIAAPAAASERRFTYTYESSVLAPGERELEPWMTWRTGRDAYYNAFDGRVELELGLSDQLQTSFYLNYSSVTAGAARDNRSSFDGVSSEWKLKLSDSVADPVGSALYLELAAGPSLAEVEAKLILDKRLGKLLAAVNLVADREWDFGVNPTVAETELQVTAGLSYAVSPALAIGLELIETNELRGLEAEVAILSGGPVISYASDTWWATLTVAPQWVALAGATRGHLNLEDAEKAQVRLVFGWHL